MARSCRINSLGSYADTNKESILFKELKDITRDDYIAAIYHLAVKKGRKTHYKDLHDNKDNLDATGELKIEVFMAEIYPRLKNDPNATKLPTILDEIRQLLLERTGFLRQHVTADTKEDNRKKKLLVELQRFQEMIDNDSVGELEFISNFIEGTYKLLNNSLDLMKQIGVKGNIEGKDISDLVDIRNEFASMGIFNDIDKLIQEPVIKEYLEKIEAERKAKGKKVVSFVDKVNFILHEKASIEEEYLRKAVPLMADWLLEYNSNTINSEVQSLVNNIRYNKRGQSFVRKDDDYQKLRKKLKDGKLTKAEFDEQVEDLAVEQILNKNMISRDSLIKDLSRAFKDKSTFSLYFDPFIYTSDKVLGLFARALKEEMYKAAMQSRDTAIRLEKEVYDKFLKASGRGTFNNENFNDGLYEEIEIYSKAHGKVIKRLSFVQPSDITKFKKNQRELYDSLHEKIMASLKSRNVKGIKYDMTKDEYYEWVKTDEGKQWKGKDKFNAYKITEDQMIRYWFSKNTEAVPDAQTRISKYSIELSQLNKAIFQLEQKSLTGELTYDDKNNLGRYRILKEERLQWWKRNVAGKDADGRWVPKGTLAQPKSSLYSNAKYDTLKKNAPLFEYYSALLEQYKSDQKRLPKSQISNNPWDEHMYWLPSIRKERNDTYIESHGNLLKAVKEDVWDALTITDTDTQFGITDNTGARVKSIPVFYTNTVEAEHVSKDIISSVLRFHSMVNDFKYKVEMHGQVILLQDIIDNRKTAETNGLGHTIWNAGAKKFGLDKFILKTQKTNYSKSLEDFIKLNFYNETTEKAMIGKWSLNKVASKLSMITGMNALAFNVLQGVNNVVLGNTLFATEAMSGHIVDKSDWTFAQKSFWQELGGIPDLGKFNSVTKNGQLGDIFDPVQGNYIDGFGKNITGPAIKKAANRDALFFLQHGGEHQMQTQTMLAILHSTTVRTKGSTDENGKYHQGELLKNDDGSNMTLYEAYKKDKSGALILDPRVGNIQLKKNPNEDLSVADIRGIIHGLNGKIHGKYNTFDKTVLQRQWYGQLLMLFRGWVVPGIRRRWGFGTEQQIDYETGMLTEGMYQSFFRLIREAVGQRRGLLASYKGMTNGEKANIMKTMSELLIFASMALIVYGLKSLEPDEEDEEIYFLMYQARRLQTDLGFYWNPIEPFKILKSPSATLTTVSKVLKLVNQVFSWNEVYDRKSGLNEKGDSKLWARTRDLIPVLNNIDKARTPSESFQWFTQFLSF